jgi:MMPL family
LACLITLWMRFGAAAQNSFTSNDPGQALLNEHFAAQSGDTLTLAIRSQAPVTSPAVQARVTQALTPFRQAAHVTGVSNPYTTPGQLSVDGHIAYATIQFDVPGSSIPGGEATALIHDARVASGTGVTFSLGGDVVDLAETPYGGPSNGIGVGAAAIVLLIAFGSLLAMGLPIATALMGIGSGLALITLLGHVFPAPGFTAITAGLIGLGVGVDYALFIVTRFRADLQDGMQPQDAVVTAMRTAGRAVLTAGTTVVIGMLGLLSGLVTLVTVVIVARVGSRLLGIRMRWRRAVLAGFAGLVLGWVAAWSINGQRRGPQTLSWPTVLFGSLIATMLVAVLLDLLARPGRLAAVEGRLRASLLPHPVRSLRQRAGRSRRYLPVTRIAARHGLSSYLSGRRPGTKGSRPLARNLRAALDEAGGMFTWNCSCTKDA